MTAQTPEPEDQQVELIERIARPVQIFAQHRLAGAALLLAATIAALIWANSPWSRGYTELFATPLTVGLGDFALSKPLLLWINDGLMSVFFFVVGLEIKREFIAGELANLRKATLPIVAAIGGMAVPALLYVLVNGSGEGARGWGIPMATDIAFALGVLALFPAPMGLKVFLTALAIVDDIGAVIVIALFYTDQVAIESLLFGGAFFLLSLVMNRLGVRNPILYFVIGTLVWFAFLKSGVHATIAAVLMAMTIPARSRIDSRRFVQGMESLLAAFRNTGVCSGRGLLSKEQHRLMHAMEQLAERATAPLQELEHALLPYVTFLVLPVFALANAGVEISSAAAAVTSPIGLGIVVGLVAGKPLGIAGATWLAVRLRIADLPAGVTWLHVLGASALAGIGFTMAIFISGLAFADPGMARSAKTAILLASTAAAVLGGLCLVRATHRQAATS